MPRKKDQTSYADNRIHFKPKTDAQFAAIDLYEKNDILFFIGPAGVGKTMLAVYCALNDKFKLIKTKRVEKIIITRPIVEAGEKLGYLPGTYLEKTSVYLLPIYDCVSKMVHSSEQFIEDNFEIAPLAYLRGRSFDQCIAILDEAQNCTVAQLRLFLSRMGQDCKIIITGDPKQSDINGKSGLLQIIKAVEDLEGVGVFAFEENHNVRHPLVAQVLKRLATIR